MSSIGKVLIGTIAAALVYVVVAIIVWRNTPAVIIDFMKFESKGESNDA